ncbi:AMP-binding protein [Microbacterium sp. SORGH_AS_0888]|uniref:AMP-binding protein n=1 Tax=Microbacterium sp. SORGH_AS_0888 TaxID=3041791 RepID=UPI00277EFA6F|nr:AMP-binding protein [Microbacterium sp. SORGH_AS_0888]MDQ1131171.1 acyl-CoA synthetase (AMP-forming)/AMP-acid ligase II [Microbacterium sp. SORGH_AS_0888]
MTIDSPFPEPVIPDASLQEFIFADLTPEDLTRTAIVDADSGETLDYGGLLARVHAAAHELRERGVRAGDVVALHAPNSSAFVIAFHAIGAVGATSTTVPVLATAEDIRRQLRAARAGFLLTHPELLVAATAPAEEAGIAADRVLDVGRLAHAPQAQPSEWHAPTADAVLPFSSGTTGHPKGVRLTHRNLVANVAQIEERMGIGPDDVIIAVLPFFHIYGLTVLVNLALRRRATLVTMPRFDLSQFLSLVERHRATFVFVAPPIALALANHPSVDEADLSSLRVVFSGAAPLDAALSARVERRLGVTVRQGYGMSEMSPVSHFVGDGEAVPHASVGKPVGGTRNRVIGIDGRSIERPQGGMSEVGELLVAGPNVMREYVNDPEATRATIDDDGFLHTGDLVTVDADGNVYIVDRLKELIKYKGYQVPPAELEAVLIDHPGIAAAAVVGAADAEAGELPVAFVVRTATSDVDADRVMAYVAERVSPYKRIRRVIFCESIPTSSAGKILRRELRARLEAEGEEAGSAV